MANSKQFCSRNIMLPKTNMRLVGLLVAFVQKKYGLIEKPFTKGAFLDICRGENIKHIPAPVGLDVGGGSYIAYRDGLFIVIPQNLPKARFLQIAGHELAHHFLNHLDTIESASIAFNPTATRGSNLSRYKRSLVEVEADYFSTLLCGSEVC